MLQTWKKIKMLDPFKIRLTQICHPMPIFQSHSPKSIVRHVYKERYRKGQHLFGSKTHKLFSTASKVHRAHAQNTILVDGLLLKNLLNMLELLPHPLTDELLHQLVVTKSLYFKVNFRIKAGENFELHIYHSKNFSKLKLLAPLLSLTNQ